MKLPNLIYSKDILTQKTYLQFSYIDIFCADNRQTSSIFANAFQWRLQVGITNDDVFPKTLYGNRHILWLEFYRELNKYLANARMFCSRKNSVPLVVLVLIFAPSLSCHNQILSQEYTDKNKWKNTVSSGCSRFLEWDNNKTSFLFCWRMKQFNNRNFYFIYL